MMAPCHGNAFRTNGPMWGESTGHRWMGPVDTDHKWSAMRNHYSDVILSAMACQITNLKVVYSTVYSGADQRKHQSTASLAFAGKSPATGEFPAQMASNAENVFIWWRHHVWYSKRTTNEAFMCIIKSRHWRQDNIMFIAVYMSSNCNYAFTVIIAGRFVEGRAEPLSALFYL